MKGFPFHCNAIHTREIVAFGAPDLMPDSLAMLALSERKLKSYRSKLVRKVLCPTLQTISRLFCIHYTIEILSILDSTDNYRLAFARLQTVEARVRSGMATRNISCWVELVLAC
jgi:hypothetical protein